MKHGREAVLARAWAVIDHGQLWRDAGFESRWDFARDVLGWSKRTAQRRRRVGWALEWYPELDAAVRDGLGLGAASLLATVLDAGTANRWLAVSSRVGRRELARAVEAARQSRDSMCVLARYERAIDAADDWSRERSGSGAPTAGAPMKVALATPATPRERRAGTGVRAAPTVLDAARWLLERVTLPKRRGFEQIKERDGHRCQNPECGKVTLRVEAHHVEHRKDGGDDSLENGLSTCRPCHLRGLHTREPARIRARAVDAGGPAILWTYAGGRQVLQFR